MHISRDRCLPGSLKFVRPFLRNLAEKDVCDLFHPCMILTSDLVTPKVDLFMLPKSDHKPMHYAIQKFLKFTHNFME